MVYDKKRKIKEALEAGRPVPTELRNEARSIKKGIELDDAKTEGTGTRFAHARAITHVPSTLRHWLPRCLFCALRPDLSALSCCAAVSPPVSPELKTHIDDEYSRVGIQDPRILLTTSRDPSSRLTQFLKELRLIFPNSQRINRGNAVIKELIEAARSNDFTDVVIVHEHRGEPDGLIVSHLPYGPTAYFGLSDVVLRHDLTSKLGTMSEAAPHLIMENFSTSLGARISQILKALFPVPKPDSRRVMTFANRDDTISFRHHVYKNTGHKEVEIGEVGPRFEAKLYQLKLGTVDMPEAESEWVLRPYFNTAKKRKAL